MDGIGLEGADELKIKTARLLEKLGHGLGHVDSRQPVLSTLLGSLDGHGLPLRLFGNGAFLIQTHYGAVGKNRRYFGGADLDSLLDDQVHVLSLGDRLAERDLAT